MAEDIVAPGVEFISYTDAESYVGLWPDLHAAGVVPDAMDAPPPRRRGNFWFKDAQHRSWRISRWGARFQVRRVRSAKERAACERAEATRNQVESVSAAIAELEGWNEGRLRSEMLSWLTASGKLLKALAAAQPLQKPSGEVVLNPGRFRYRQSFIEELNRSLMDIELLIMRETVDEDRGRLLALKAALHAKTDARFVSFMAASSSAQQV